MDGDARTKRITDQTILIIYDAFIQKLNTALIKEHLPACSSNNLNARARIAVSVTFAQERTFKEAAILRRLSLAFAIKAQFWRLDFGLINFGRGGPTAQVVLSSSSCSRLACTGKRFAFLPLYLFLYIVHHLVCVVSISLVTLADVSSTQRLFLLPLLVLFPPACETRGTLVKYLTRQLVVLY